MEDVKFYSVSDNSFGTRGFPWLYRINEGLKEIYICKKCPRVITYAKGDIVGILDREKGSKWPDVLGCGHFPFFIVSSRTMEAFSKENLLEFPYYKVLIEKPYPQKLDESSKLDYYWIDGSRMLGVKLDFEASGFVGNKFCPECGTRTDDIGATYNNQRMGFSYIFKEKTWDRSNIFTSDISDTYFFCTEKIVTCAKKYKLTNFKFVPKEKGHELRGIKYM